VDEGNRFVNRIVENGGLAIGMGNSKADPFFSCIDGVGLSRLIEVFCGDSVDVNAVILMGIDDFWNAERFADDFSVEFDVVGMVGRPVAEVQGAEPPLAHASMARKGSM
jgi:hypothetical protein